MTHTLRLAAAPGRLLLLLAALLVLAAYAMQVNNSGFSSRHADSLASSPAIAPATAPVVAPAGEPATSVGQSAPVSTRTIQRAPAPAAPAQAAPSATRESNTAPANPGSPTCTSGGPPAAPGVASRCLGG